MRHVFLTPVYQFTIMKKLLLVIGLFVFKASFAQDTTIVFSGPPVIIHKDPRADALVRKQAAINIAAKKSTGHTMRGYRLLVLSTQSRDEAIAAKTKIYTHFPDLKAYLTFQSPFFKLKAGNFQTRSEAKQYQSLMNSLFSKGVYIISDVIEVKPEIEPDESR